MVTTLITQTLTMIISKRTIVKKVCRGYALLILASSNVRSNLTQIALQRYEIILILQNKIKQKHEKNRKN